MGQRSVPWAGGIWVPQKHPSLSLCLSTATAGSWACDLKNAADASLGVQRKLSFNLTQTLGGAETPDGARTPGSRPLSAPAASVTWGEPSHLNISGGQK